MFHSAITEVEMKNIRKFSLSLILGLLFFLSLAGQITTGLKSYNDDRKEKGLNIISSFSEYLSSGHFISSLSENMESEFLQMALFVYLTVFFYQIGSAESKKLPEDLTEKEYKDQVEENQFRKLKINKHPILWRIYENSLTLSLLTLFTFFFVLHAYGSMTLINEQKQNLKKPLINFWQVFAEQEFWFESFQNWQSEFFSIVTLGLLSIFLRQKGSPQSKKLNSSHWKTGSS